MREKQYRKSWADRIEKERIRAEAEAEAELGRLRTAVRETHALEAGASVFGLTAPDAATDAAATRSQIQSRLRALREAVLFDAGQPEATRIEVLAGGNLPIGENKALTLRVLRLIGNAEEPEPVRLAALTAFLSATFAIRTFAEWRPTYLETIRRIAHTEANQLATRALQILAQEQDPWALETAQAGLRRPEEARLDPAQAVRYLAPQDHGDHLDILREIARSRRRSEVRVEAIRGLSGDPEARGLLCELVDNTKQPVAVRQAALLSLRILDEDAYRERAARIVADPKENADLRAASITAMRLDTDPKTSELTPAVRKIAEEAPPKVLERAAQLYLSQAE